MGPWGTDAIKFFNELKAEKTITCHEQNNFCNNEYKYSAIQRANAASVIGTFFEAKKMEEIFY